MAECRILDYPKWSSFQNLQMALEAKEEHVGLGRIVCLMTSQNLILGTKPNLGFDIVRIDLFGGNILYNVCECISDQLLRVHPG